MQRRYIGVAHFFLLFLVPDMAILRVFLILDDFSIFQPETPDIPGIWPKYLEKLGVTKDPFFNQNKAI